MVCPHNTPLRLGAKLEATVDMANKLRYRRYPYLMLLVEYFVPRQTKASMGQRKKLGVPQSHLAAHTR
jgi:hypothetical protein